MAPLCHTESIRKRPPDTPHFRWPPSTSRLLNTQDKPICLVINKCDASATLSHWQIELALRLPDLVALNPGRLSIVYTSALMGEAVGDVMEWLVAARVGRDAAAGPRGRGRKGSAATPAAAGVRSSGTVTSEQGG